MLCNNLTDHPRSLQIFDDEIHASIHSDKTKEGLSLFGEQRALYSFPILRESSYCARYIIRDSQCYKNITRPETSQKLVPATMFISRNYRLAARCVILFSET
jgi:hypothetical protein